MQKQYNANSIDILKGLEPVRLRPSMYIGNVDVSGLHHLVYEVIDNSIDESMAGFCDEIKVNIYSDNSVSVEDNGRGIPIDIHEREKIPALEVVLTKLHAGGKFDNDNYKVSGGLHGVGISVVNALSEKLEVEVYSNEKIYFQTYSRGKKTSDLKILGKTSKKGTKIHFLPDKKIFKGKIEYSYNILARRLRELAFLNKGLNISLEDERKDIKKNFFYKGGLSSFVQYINKRCTVLHEPASIYGTKGDVKIYVSLQYNNTFKENIFSFANNINTLEGGTHLVGFKSALTRTINQYALKSNLPKNNIFKINGEDAREGLSAVISIRLKSPQFEGQTKTKLGNSKVKGFVESLINEKLSDFFEENPSIAKKIINKSMEAARARNAAKKARDLARNKGSLAESTLPGKLAECQLSDPKQRELFLVEGASAGGSAKQGRDRKFQAILPLKGKILNVEKARIDKILRNDEIRNIITVLGTGIGTEEYNINKIRYHKIIIMTDADVDGSHIRTLILTFFYRHMPKLFEKEYLYIAQPPLYRISNKKNEYYINSYLELNNFLLKKISNERSILLDKEKIKLHGKELKIFLDNLNNYFIEFSKIKKKGFDSSIISILISEKVSDKNFLQNKEKMINLEALIKNIGYKTKGITWNEKNKTFEIQFLSKEYNISNHNKFSVINKNIIYFSHFQKCLNIWKKIFFLDKPPFKILDNNNNEISIAENKKKLLEVLLSYANLGIQTQRYKGLGEMNPEQLWKTTMNPKKRKLLKVIIDDPVGADEIFTILMGDEVEPRREFIQTNALEVNNLDI